MSCTAGVQNKQHLMNDESKERASVAAKGTTSSKSLWFFLVMVGRTIWFVPRVQHIRALKYASSVAGLRCVRGRCCCNLLHVCAILSPSQGKLPSVYGHHPPS
eukprot:260366-Amphidinium_carterae.1